MHQSYYDSRKLRCMAIINKLWGIAWDLWGHKNAVLYKQRNNTIGKNLHLLNYNVREANSIHKSVILPSLNQYLFTLPLTQLLKQTASCKKAWLHHLVPKLGTSVMKPVKRKSVMTLEKSAICLAVVTGL